MRTLTLAALLLLAQAPGFGPLDGLDLPATDLDRVGVGDEAPDFRLEDESGTVHQLSHYRDRQNVVLVFFRGHW